METTLTGASGRRYVIFPEEVTWRFDGTNDTVEDDSNVVLIVGLYEGDVFVPIDILYVPGSILPYFRQWGSGEHWVREWGATHVAVHHYDPDRERAKDIVSDLQKAYPRPSRRQ